MDNVQTPITRREARERKTTTSHADVPRYVLRNKKKYQYKETIKRLPPVLTTDKEHAKNMPNFKDVSTLSVVVSDTEKVYGEWGEAMSGIAPEILVKQEMAKQIEEKETFLSEQMEILDGAEKIKVNYVAPEINPHTVLTTDDFSKIPSRAREIAKEHHVEKLVAYKEARDVHLAFPSEQQIPPIATKLETSRAISLELPHEKVVTVKNLEEIPDETAREYARTHPLADKESERFDEPQEEDVPINLVIGKRLAYIPFSSTSKPHYEIADSLEELEEKIIQNFSEEEKEEILAVAKKRTFFYPPENENRKEFRLMQGEDLAEKLELSGYSAADALLIAKTAEIVHMEIHYGTPKHSNHDYSGEAENTIELAEKLKNISLMSEAHVHQITRHARKISSSPNVYAWSCTEGYTYAWSEKRGYIWSSAIVPTHHWFEPKYEYGLEFQYGWSVAHSYSYAKTFDFTLKTPQYVCRVVEPKIKIVKNEMYSFEIEQIEYSWLNK